MITRTILYIYFLVFIASIAFYMVRISLALKMRIDLESTVFEATAVISSFMLARAFFSTVFGILTDKHPRLRSVMIKFSALFISIIIFLYSIAREPLQIIVLSFLHGLFSGILWPNVQVILGFEAKGRNLILSTYFALASFGGSVGYLLYGILLLSNDQILIIGSVLYLISFLFSLAAIKDGGIIKGEKKFDRKFMYKIFDRTIIWILLVAFISGSIFGITSNYLYIFLYEYCSIDRKKVAYILSISSLISILGMILTGYIADRIGLIRTIILLLMTCSLGFILILNNFYTTLIAVPMIIVSSNALLPLTRNVKIVRDKSFTGTVIGLSNTLSNLGTFFSPLLAGYLYDIGEKTTIFLYHLIICFLLISCGILILKHFGKYKYGIILI